MANSRIWFSFVNELKEHISDLYVVNKLITAACSSMEGLEVDTAMNLLIAANEFLSLQTEIIYSDLETAQKDFVTPISHAASTEEVDVFG